MSHRAGGQLLVAADIFYCQSRKISPAARAVRGTRPALDCIIARLDPRLVGRVRREIVELLTVDPIAGANPDCLEPVEHVQFGQRHTGDAADGDRLPDQHGVEPAATTAPAGNGPELVAALAQLLPDFIVLLGREGTRTDAGRVG